MGHGDGRSRGGMPAPPPTHTFLQSNDFFMPMKFISFDIFCQSMEAHFTHFLLNLSMLTFGIKVNKAFLSYFPHMRVDTIFHSLTSTTYSSNMSGKRVTDFFKPNVSKSSEGVNTNPQDASVEQENDPNLNEKQCRDCPQRRGNFPSTKTLHFSENKNRGLRSNVSATLVQRFSKATL